MEIHNLTTEQLRKLVKAIGDGSDWPKITDDPKVNFAVDCIINDRNDNEEIIYDEQLYVEEIEAFRARGSFDLEKK